MVIKYNNSGIQGITVEGCETDIVPELLLSFDDDFINGLRDIYGSFKLILANRILHHVHDIENLSLYLFLYRVFS